MVSRQEKPNAAESRQPLMQKVKGQGIRKQRPQQPVRRSARLQNNKNNINAKHPLPSLSMSPPKPQNTTTTTTTTQKQRRLQEAETHSDNLIEKQAQTSRRTSYYYNVENKEPPRDITATSKKIEHWIWEGRWPKEYFEPINMDLLPRKKKSNASLRENSAANTYFTGGDVTRAARNPGYEKQLMRAGIFLDGDVGTISDTCARLCRVLLTEEQPVPQVSLFQDDVFKTMTVPRYRQKNEPMVFRDVTPLIVPSAELLYVFGATYLEHVREDVNILWTKCICLAEGPCPKPDLTIGLKESIFTREEYEKLRPYIGGSGETCYVKVTDDIFFPFLMCEAKCGEIGLTVADRQNAHSTSIAVNAIVRLYKAVKREGEINRKVLAFSISHDNQMVRIYGHYPVIDGDGTKFYRYTIHIFDFTIHEGIERWTAYKFTRNIYDEFLPVHVERIKSAVIQLPD